MTREQWLERAPELEPDESLALKVWKFCDGWNPERIPIAAAYFSVRDLARLTDLLITLREVLEARRTAEEDANAGRVD